MARSTWPAGSARGRVSTSTFRSTTPDRKRWSRSKRRRQRSRRISTVAKSRQLAQSLEPLRPDMRVLYMSGYTDDTVLRYGVQEDKVPFLQKPFTPDVLVDKVRQVINGG